MNIVIFKYLILPSRLQPNGSSESQHDENFLARNLLQLGRKEIFDMTSFRKIVIAGLARNLENQIIKTCEVLRSAFSMFQEIHWIVIESDSTDATVEKLEDLSCRFDNFKFKSLGSLSQTLNMRTERIAFCRNEYIKILNDNPVYQDCQYVVVADLDGVNDDLTKEAVASCWNNDGWAACAANQAGPYYDIWALKCEDWNSSDCWSQYQFLRKFLKDDWALLISVVGKMICIDRNNGFIEVDSAFGGLVIYEKKYIVGQKYVGITSNKQEVCEHLNFNAHIRKNGGKIFINPGMINSGLNEHTIPYQKILNSVRKVGHA